MSNKTRKQRCVNISHSQFMKAWKRAITYFRVENLKQKNRKEIERELLRCFKKGVKGLKK